MKTIFQTACLFFISFGINAQNLIAVQNGATPSFYQQVDSALIHAQNGDTIYIPGGTWSITKPISKRIHLIGVGHHPDSTIATFPTTIVGTVTLASGASNGSMTGIYLKGGINGTNDPVNSYTIFRSRITGNIRFLTSNSNLTCIENIFEASFLYDNGSGNNCSFLNNLFRGYFYGAIPVINSSFKNNIFFMEQYTYAGNTNYPIKGQYLVCENNIFLSQYSSSGFSILSNSIANNNLFSENISFPLGTNTGANNIVAQAGNSIFESGSYHLKSDCPGKNAGKDGTDIGIYGGIYPWKDGPIPTNPHFQSIKIDPTTDSNGDLNVKIKVAAQEK